MITPLDNKEMQYINGGLIDPVSLTVIGIALAYSFWAANFCYNLGKD